MTAEKTTNKPDIKELMSLYEAGKASPSAINELGKAFYNGEGVATDKERGLALFKEAAMKGSTGGVYNMAAVLHNGDAGGRDLSSAVDMFDEVIKRGKGDVMGKWSAKEVEKRVYKNAFYQLTASHIIKVNPWLAGRQGSIANILWQELQENNGLYSKISQPEAKHDKKIAELIKFDFAGGDELTFARAEKVIRETVSKYAKALKQEGKQRGDGYTMLA